MILYYYEMFDKNGNAEISNEIEKRMELGEKRKYILSYIKTKIASLTTISSFDVFHVIFSGISVLKHEH